MAESPIAALEKLASPSAQLADLSETERLHALKLCDALTNRLERPFETFVRHLWAQHGTQLGIRLGMEWKLFEALGRVGNDPKTSSDLAAACVHKPDPILVARFLRHLGAVNVIRQVDSEIYGATPFSEALQTEAFQNGVKFLFDDFANVPSGVPAWLAENGWKNPDNIADTSATRAFGVSTSMYEYFNERRDVGRHFGGFMVAYSADRPSFWDPAFYPVRERLGSETSNEDVLLVDIGGGDGHDLAQFRAAFPELKGKLVLQELPHIVERVTNEHYEAMVHDWNRPQPIEGARAYMFHHILHDFGNDDEVRRLLKNIISAMRPGWSKLIIKDAIVPNKGAGYILTGLDLGVMQALAGRERTEAEWRELIESVGLKIEGIFTHERSDDGIIECVLVEG